MNKFYKFEGSGAQNIFVLKVASVSSLANPYYFQEEENKENRVKR